jgi:hypothetical protein
MEILVPQPVEDSRELRGTKISRPGVMGTLPATYSGIAQLVEQRTVNPRVVGSSPTAGANSHPQTTTNHHKNITKPLPRISSPFPAIQSGRRRAAIRPRLRPSRNSEWQRNDSSKRATLSAT